MIFSLINHIICTSVHHVQYGEVSEKMTFVVSEANVPNLPAGNCLKLLCQVTQKGDLGACHFISEPINLSGCPV